MTDPTSSESASDASGGSLPEGLGSLSAGTLAALLDHLEARADLLRWEAREVKTRLVVRLVALAAGAVMLLAAYAVALAALVGWLSLSGSLTWPAAAVLVALGQLLLGAILLVFACKRREATALFPDTLAELRRDRETLRRRAGATRPPDPR